MIAGSVESLGDLMTTFFRRFFVLLIGFPLAVVLVGARTSRVEGESRPIA